LASSCKGLSVTAATEQDLQCPARVGFSIVAHIVIARAACQDLVNRVQPLIRSGFCAWTRVHQAL